MCPKGETSNICLYILLLFLLLPRTNITGTDGGSNLTFPVFAVAISLSVVLAVPKRLSLPLPPPRPFHSASSESSAVEFASIYSSILRNKRSTCTKKPSRENIF